MSENNQPIDTLRDGNLKATLWLNEGENGQFITTTITRIYTDAKGEVRETSGLVGTDLLRAKELAGEAYARQRELRRELAQAPDRESQREGASREFARSRSRTAPRRAR